MSSLALMVIIAGALLAFATRPRTNLGYGLSSIVTAPLKLVLVLIAALVAFTLVARAQHSAPGSASGPAPRPVVTTAQTNPVAAYWRTRHLSRTVSVAALDTVARACEAAEGLSPISTCAGGLPVLVIGGAAHPAISRFDADTLASYPEWHLLVYDGGATKKAEQIGRNWYNDPRWASVTHGACDRAVRTTTTVLVHDCQEIPFYKVTEGGPLPPAGQPPARVALLNGAENRSEGGLLGAMVKTCSIPAAPAGALPGQPAAARATFIFLAVPDSATPSFYICGARAT